jgi:methionyl-tRNA formyltransferase
MEKNKLKIAFLLDPSNCWLKTYLLSSNFFKKKNKNIFKLFTSFKKIKNYDFVFILGLTKILKESFLRQNTLNLVVHESKLPKGKGFSPVAWQILGERKKYPFVYLKQNLKLIVVKFILKIKCVLTVLNYMMK